SIPDSFGNLTKVTYFYLSSNNFTGHIPSSLSNLKDLTFVDFGCNNFEGTFPHFLTNLTKLTYVDLNSNNLIGQIGEFQGTKSLETLSLYNNKLNGSIPKSISNLVSLQKFDISSNNFNGTIEFDMFSKLIEIEVLDLSYNSLSLSINNNLKYTFPKLQHLELASCSITKFPYFLRTLEELNTLDLSNNRIKGQIPQWMFKVVENLKFLNLSHNSLSRIDHIPGKNLEYLDLHANLLKGTFPVPPSSVVFFFISNNNLTGEIPSSICNLASLQILDVSYNNLSGMIPRCLGNFSDYLSVMDLRMNRFQGTIPGSFAKCNSLRTLVLNHNQLEGLLPQSLVNCTKLEVLDLGNNNINDSFPYWLEALPKLQVLILRSNRFYGQIDHFKENSSFDMLRIIDLSHNNFTGLLPSKFFEGLEAIITVNESEVKSKYIGEDYYQDSVMVSLKGHDFELQRILTIFTTIDLSSNKFHGQIPKVLGTLKFLRDLNLSHNSLTGYIPSSLANLSVLESLDISSNMLNGSIPMQLTSLTFLEILNLSQNLLTGPIPQGSQFSTFENNSYIGNIGLCGSPLTMKCMISEQPPPSIFQENNDLMFTSGFGWKAVVMGYGCGFMFGLVMGYLVLRTGKPQWVVSLIKGE
ncbi:receptor-like protein Cf-9 homolog, partial [Fagus crenata]